MRRTGLPYALAGLFFTIGCADSGDAPTGPSDLASHDASTDVPAPTIEGAADEDALTDASQEGGWDQGDVGTPDADAQDVAFDVSFDSAIDSSDAGTCSMRELKIVAHQDDDLLFMTPDLIESIHDGHCMRTVYVTAGDAGRGEAYYLARETGIRAVYAKMAGRNDAWSVSMGTFATKPIHIETLQDANVSVMFMRLPDGKPDGLGFPATNLQSLRKLTMGTLNVIGTLDNSNSFTRPELLATLAAIIADFQPDIIDVQEIVNEFGGDHSDHLEVAALANQAQASYQRPHRVRAHRDYSISLLPINLSPGAIDEKWTNFLVYAKYDLQICPGGACPTSGEYVDWSRRQYPYFAGSVVGYGGKCLSLRGSVDAPGTLAEIGTCTGEDGQHWALTSDGHLKSLSLCLEVTGGSSVNGTPLQMAPCQDVAYQRWSLTGGRFQVLGTKCMQVQSSTATRGVPVEISDCTTAAQQGFWHYPGP
jgi:LmbE family N-acetylglucosaminyl deacetylase